MNNKSKTGFTLIELLAVIVILAIIALIATPIIVGILDNVRKEGFKDTAYGVIKAGELGYANDLLNTNIEEVIFTYANGVESSSISGKKLNYKGTKPQSGTVIINTQGQIAIAIHNGKYCAIKGFKDKEVTLSNKIEIECKLGDTPPDTPPEETFTCGDDLIDSRDNNIYKTLKIGNQCWMTENLRYDCSLAGYNNVGSANSWSGTNNCGDQGTIYNVVLYQWSVAMNGSTTEGAQGLCPTDWHIPTDSEWKELERYLGITQAEIDNTSFRGTDQGDQLRSTNPSWCRSTTNCATSGFNALPDGCRRDNGYFYGVGSDAYWWSSSLSAPNAWYRYLNSGYSSIGRHSISQTWGLSIRCLFGE